MKKNKTNAPAAPLTEAQKDKLANLLKLDPKAMDAFEEAYRNCLPGNPDHGLFSKSVQDMKSTTRVTPGVLVRRIVDELLGDKDAAATPVTKEEIMALPPDLRPQLTGTLMQTDCPGDSSEVLLSLFLRSQEEQDPKLAKHAYGMFRAGLDMLDLDPCAYEILGRNIASMGYWFPALKNAIDMQSFFKVPETQIVKVPLPILQMSRLDYANLTATTLHIVNEWCQRAFTLEEDKAYFVKTGIFSAKYDFRNTKVVGAKEVREIGEYLLYISHLASSMTSMTTKPVIYGAATTNEWVVREYIEDKEDNPCIYKGMPLHTEYRVFVDFDEGSVLGISPYWRPDVMKARFDKGLDRNDPSMIHDAVIYRAHEETLMARYEQNKDTVLTHVKELLPNVLLHGQWSLDVMQNGTDFYVIDMAPAAISALNDVVPEGKLKAPDEMRWITGLESQRSAR